MLDHAEYTAPTWQHELHCTDDTDHTDDTDYADYTDHIDQESLCPEDSTVDHDVGSNDRISDRWVHASQ